MNLGYQEDDKHLFDYKLYELENFFCRGPKPDFSKKYFCCLGGAHTFGRFCENPYLNLLEKKIKIQGVNLGFAGVGPSFFLNKFSNVINSSDFCIIQIFSGRSASNSLFLNEEGTNFGFSIIHDKKITPYEFWRYVIKQKKQEEINQLVEETRKNYKEKFKELLLKIKKPKILFWFSKRFPESYKEQIKTDDVSIFWNSFPQFVNKEMIDELKKYADMYIECVVRTQGEQLKDKVANTFFKKHVFDPNKMCFINYNNYYPTKKMHQIASKKLNKVIFKKFL